MNKSMNIIPTPKYCTYVDGCEFSVASICVVGEITPIIKSGLDVLRRENISFESTSENADFIVYSDFNELPEGVFTKDELSVFGEKNGKEQGYVLKYPVNGKIIAVAQNDQGAAYAMMTLLQIVGIKTGGFTISDAPDFSRRGIKWTIWAETGCWCYDFGDGVDAIKERFIRKLDMLFKYKINLVYADGYGYDTERFEGYAELMRFLCDEGRKRGMKIAAGAYSMSYGLALHKNNSYQGRVYYNQKGYPNGEVYECLGRYLASKKMSSNRTMGTCLSNDELFELKIEEMVHFVKTTHITALTLHNMDSHEVHPEMWLDRCDECKKRWPNDSLFAKDGMAGAFAEFIDKIMDRLREVKDGDYDAARDLTIRMTAPGYLYYNHTNDENFDNGIKFWKCVSEYVKNPTNVAIGLREEYFYHDKPELRAKTIVQNIKKFSAVMATFNGCDGFYDDKLFTITSSLNYMMKDTGGGITCFNGTFFTEPMALCNSEYFWNSENSGFYNISEKPQNYSEFRKLFVSMLESRFRPDEVYGKGGFVDVICHKLYGDAAGAEMGEIYKIGGKNGEPPVACACSVDIYTNYGITQYPMSWENVLESDEIDKKCERFYQCHESSKKAYNILSELLTRFDGDEAMKNELTVLCECFYMGKLLTGLLSEYMELYKKLDASLAGGQKLEMSLRNEIVDLQKHSAEFLKYVESNKAKPVDKFGGIFIGRDEVSSFLVKNSALLLMSFDKQKRLPEGDKNLNTLDWTE